MKRTERVGAMIKILMDKKNMLITFSGIVKTESQLGSY